MELYHVTLKDETGCYFTREFVADSYEAARAAAREYYPESTVSEVQTPADVRQEEADRYHRLMDEMDGDGYDAGYDYLNGDY